MSRARNDRNIVKFGPTRAGLDPELKSLRDENRRLQFRLERQILTAPEIVPPTTGPVVPGDLNTALEAGFPYLLNPLGDVYASRYSTDYPYKFSRATGGVTDSSGVMLRGTASVQFVEFPSGTTTSIPFVGYIYQGNPFVVEDRLVVPMVGSRDNDVVMYNLSSSEYSVGTNAFSNFRVSGAFSYGSLFYTFNNTTAGSFVNTRLNKYDLTFTRTAGPEFDAGESQAGLTANGNVAWAATITGLYRIDMSDPLNLTTRYELAINDRLYSRQVNKGFVGDSDRLFVMQWNGTSGLWEILRIGAGAIRSTLPLVFSGNPFDQPNFIDSTGAAVSAQSSVIHQPGVAAGPNGGFFIYGGLAQDFGETDSYGNPVIVSVPAIWYTDGTSTQRVWTLPDSVEFPLDMLYVASDRTHNASSSSSSISTLTRYLRERRLESCVSYLEYNPTTNKVEFLVRVGSGYIDYSTNRLENAGSASYLYRAQL